MSPSMAWVLSDQAPLSGANGGPRAGANHPQASYDNLLLLRATTGPRGGRRDGLAQVAPKTVTRTIGSTIARQIARGVLGSLLGGGGKR